MGEQHAKTDGDLQQRDRNYQKELHGNQYKNINKMKKIKIQ